jgi:hypothetical protein
LKNLNIVGILKGVIEGKKEEKLAIITQLGLRGS